MAYAFIHTISFSLVLILSCLTATTSSSSDSSDVHRTLSMKLNPGCPITICHNDSRPFRNLVHVTATGPSDVIHYVWSTIDAPTLLIVYADLNSSLSLNWTALITHTPGSISVNKHKYSFAIVFSRLFEFNDMNDTARIDQIHYHNTSYFRVTDLGNVSWKNFAEGMDMSTFSGVFETQDMSKHYKNGSLQIDLRAFAQSGRHTVLPRLSYTSNSTQFDVILNNLLPNFKKSRFAVEFQLLSSYKPAKDETMDFHISKSIDDEYTPGVFQIVDILSPHPPGLYGGYVEWKPVCYTAKSHTIEDSVHSQRYEVERLGGPGVVASVGHTYHMGLPGGLTHTLLAAFNISYGMPEDGFFTNTNYTFWTASVGYGTPPYDSISSTLIIIIAAGVGIPLLLIIVGGIYVGVRKRRMRTTTDLRPLITNNDYGAINT